MNQKKTIILAYHGVADKVAEGSGWIEYGARRYELEKLCISPVLFEKQLAYLRGKGYRVISLKELIERKQKRLTPPRTVAITFDDGFQNCFTSAFPLLKKYGYLATIFLVTDKINTNQFLSWDEILEMEKQGFSFGVHTLSHPPLTSLTSGEARKEIEESKRIIEQKLASPVDFFSYPYGDFNPAVEALVKEAGFLGAVVTPKGPGIKEGPYSLKRVGINRDNSMLTFKFKLKSYFSWLRERKFLWKILRKIKKIK